MTSLGHRRQYRYDSRSRANRKHKEGRRQARGMRLDHRYTAHADGRMHARACLYLPVCAGMRAHMRHAARVFGSAIVVACVNMCACASCNGGSARACNNAGARARCILSCAPVGAHARECNGVCTHTRSPAPRARRRTCARVMVGPRAQPPAYSFPRVRARAWDAKCTRPVVPVRAGPYVRHCMSTRAPLGMCLRACVCLRARVRVRTPARRCECARACV